MKLPEPKHLPSGNWFIHLRLGGENIPVTAATKKECVDTARWIKSEYKAGKRKTAMQLPETTLRQGIDAYIQARQNSLSPSTIRGYRIIQKNQFQKYIDVPISKIHDWQEVYDSEKNRLNPKTLKNSFTFLKSVYEDQTKLKMPKISMIQVVPKEKDFFDAEQIRLFLEAVKGTRCEIGALLALSSLRCSEILDLEWKDVDLKHNRIFVQGAVVMDENNKRVKKDTNKTDKSQRYVPIFISQLHDALEASVQAEGPVVHYKTESGLLKAINHVCEKAKLPQVGIHGLRHSFASLCVHLQIPEETAMSIGGWSDFTTMRKIYTHISQRDKQNHINALTAFYNQETKNANENANGA